MYKGEFSQTNGTQILAENGKHYTKDENLKVSTNWEDSEY